MFFQAMLSNCTFPLKNNSERPTPFLNLGFHCLLLVLLVSSMSSCAHTSGDSQPQFVEEIGETPEGSKANRDPFLAARLGPGDVLEIRVFQEEELSGVHRVGPEGSVQFPLCGTVEVLERTAAEVAEAVRECLVKGRFMLEPQVTVMPREFHSKKIFVLGHVAQPGTFAFENGMNIVQVITLAGGFSDFANQNAVNVTRKTARGKELRFQVPVADVGTGKAPNFLLEPGDIVHVPRGLF